MPNSSENYADSLHLSLKPSRLLNRGLAALHALAALCALANPAPWWVKLLLLTAIALSFRVSRRDHLLDPLVRAVTLIGDGYAMAHCRFGAVRAALAEGTVVTTWIVILRLRSDAGKPLAIPICRDSLDAEPFRRLRVGLRCGMWLADRGSA